MSSGLDLHSPGATSPPWGTSRVCVSESWAEHCPELPLEVVMPQVPAAATANPAPCLPKSVTEGPDPLVDAHVRRHRAALSLGGLRGHSCAWLQCLCLVLAGKLTGDCRNGLW